jgi:hypothetical protein
VHDAWAAEATRWAREAGVVNAVAAFNAAAIAL